MITAIRIEEGDDGEDDHTRDGRRTGAAAACPPRAGVAGQPVDGAPDPDAPARYLGEGNEATATYLAKRPGSPESRMLAHFGGHAAHSAMGDA
jgi:hypothetical protein